MKIIVAHPGRQHSFHVATALEKRGMLYRYITTVYNNSSSFYMNIALLITTGDEKERAKKRKCPSVEDNKVIQFNELEGLMLIVLNKYLPSLFTRFNQYVSNRFQKKLSKYIIKNGIDVVISYDTNSNILFDILSEKVPNVIKIMDNAHPCRNYLYEVYQNHLSNCGEFVKTLDDCGFITNKKNADQYGIEALKADYHIVASTFSQQALIYNGISKDKIFIIPYGVNSDFSNKYKKYDGTLKVLFVGEVNQRKGIYQVLSSAKELYNYDIEFNIIGRGRDVSLTKPYEKYINFYGHISYERLIEFYQTSHIFIFPTMGEGFGLVILEALKAGLPVISTTNCGAQDVISNGENGYIIDVCDTKSLINKILYFYNNRNELQRMSINAIASVNNYSWDGYEKKIVDTMETILKREFNGL